MFKVVDGWRRGAIEELEKKVLFGEAPLSQFGVFHRVRRAITNPRFSHGAQAN